MKKFILSVVVCCLLTIPAFAVNWLDYSYTDENGVRVIDVDSYNAAVAEEKVAAAGLDLDVNLFWMFDESGTVVFDNDSFELAYAAALAEKQNSEALVVEDSVDVPIQDIVEDPVDEPFEEPLDSSSVDDPPLLLEEEDSPMVYVVFDERSDAGYSLDLLSGLKALIVSIFGEYSPVMTTIAVTETVDNVTSTTLIEAVAAGAAGVDYVWLSGVFLFGILLFCLMKLLGGLLK